MRIPALVLLLGIVLAVPGCAKKQPTAPPGTGSSISGVVRLGTAPLAGATVHLSGASTASTTTAANGSYLFSGLAPGNYVVDLSQSGHATSPVGAWVSLPGASSNVDFRLTTTPSLFALGGVVSGAAGVRMVLGGDNTGNTLADANGTWLMVGLLLGDYTLTPLKDGYHFNPPSRTLVGSVTFEHPETGNGTLGTVTIASVLHGAQDASAFFEITSPPVDGAGSIRARRASEIAGGSIAAYNAMWDAGGTVVVTFAHALGSDTIVIHLGPVPTVVVSSATFTVTQTFAGGTDFAALPH
jgi:hypothetical protein